MKHTPVKDRCCQNPDCPLYGIFGKGNIIRHSFYTTRQGRRRRFCCKICKRTFSSTAGTPYYRLHKSRSSFDELAQMTVEGIGISAIARIKGYAWNTVARWRQLAALFANRFNDRMLKGFELKELQGDEIRTFVKTKKKPVWIFTILEVWSRLWISCVIGRCNYRNVKQVIGNAIQRGEYKERFLPVVSLSNHFTTDGFEPYAWAMKAMLSVICIYAVVMKKRRKDRVVHVDRNLIVGTGDQLEEALFNSEDSSTINTSFIERHNLTIRQGSSYLCRKTACHSREQERLDENMFLLMCYYNFIRPHMALKFGNEIRTPAMQAGLISKKLSFRELFTSREILFIFAVIVVLVWREKWTPKAETNTITTVA